MDIFKGLPFGDEPIDGFAYILVRDLLQTQSTNVSLVLWTEHDFTRNFTYGEILHVFKLTVVKEW